MADSVDAARVEQKSVKDTSALVRIKRIEEQILVIRGQKVIVDADLAQYQAVRRKRDRCPRDFMFALTDEEKTEVVTNCDHFFLRRGHQGLRT